ncbi:lectin subunit alpha-like [Musca vetustissima]|uniref:lectin subunit alpha-like n=1 Tax=Musca vetustissima TaxID=27455 RepID=UPI002AB60BCF|nr:lectin subunit alpha-like [Musca vetustissima]
MMLAPQHLKYFVFFILSIRCVFGEEKWYDASDGSKYLVIDEDNYNWFEALTACSTRGLGLVSIRSEEKQNALVEVLKKTGKMYYWIGALGTYSTDTGLVFKWINDGEEFDYTNWAPNEPNGRGQENCVHLDRFNYRWNDNNCRTNKKALVCEELPRVTDMKKYISALERFLDDFMAEEL